MFGDPLVYIQKFDMSHRQKVKYIKNEKAKQLNFREQHGWKLRTKTDQVHQAFNAKLDQERQNLVRQFLREDEARRRSFGGLETNNKMIN